MKKLFILALITLFSSISPPDAKAQAGRLQIGILADVTDQRILLDIQAHPTIRYFITNSVMVSASGLYDHSGTYDRKYLNFAGRLYPFRKKSLYGQVGEETNFDGGNLFNTQVGYTSNFGWFWVEPYVN